MRGLPHGLDAGLHRTSSFNIPCSTFCAFKLLGFPLTLSPATKDVGAGESLAGERGLDFALSGLTRSRTARSLAVGRSFPRLARGLTALGSRGRA